MLFVDFRVLICYSSVIDIIYTRGDTVSKITIDKNACKGCGLCVTVCPKEILALSETELNDKGYNPVEITDMDKCIACAACARMCPDVVFTIEK